MKISHSYLNITTAWTNHYYQHYDLKYRTHQVDKNLPAIIENLCVKMSRESFCMVLVLDHSWLWFVSEVRKLIPEQRYWPTSLENIKQWEKVNLTLYKCNMCLLLLWTCATSSELSKYINYMAMEHMSIQVPCARLKVLMVVIITTPGL
jgi:uncharacterized ubiquitin-like protein YukD